MHKQVRALIVEDSVDDTFFIVRELQRGGFHVDFERVETHAAMQAALEAQEWDVVISDYAMPQFDGAKALALFKHTGLDIPFILVSGALGEERAVEMLKGGANDYVKKERLERLAPVVERELAAAQERQLRRQREVSATYLASLVQSCEDAIIGKTLEGIITSWNAGAERLYGYSAVEMIGRSIRVLVPHARSGELDAMLGRIRDGGPVERLETVRLRKDGRSVEVSLTISPIKDADGQVIGASTVARDITQRKRKESERLNLIQELTAALSQA